MMYYYYCSNINRSHFSNIIITFIWQEERNQKGMDSTQIFPDISSDVLNMHIFIYVTICILHECGDPVISLPLQSKHKVALCGENVSD